MKVQPIQSVFMTAWGAEAFMFTENFEMSPQRIPSKATEPCKLKVGTESCKASDKNTVIIHDTLILPKPCRTLKAVLSPIVADDCCHMPNKN